MKKMKRIIFVFLLLVCICVPVCGIEYEAPQAPEAAEPHMPPESRNFGQDLWYVIRSVVQQLQPDMAEAGRTCLFLIAAVLCVGLMRTHSTLSSSAVDLTGTISIAVLLLEPSRTMLRLGIETVTELSEYGKLLIPVLAGSMVAQGGTTTAGTLYTGSMIFLTFLNVLIRNVIVPMISIYFAACVACGVCNEQGVQRFRDMLKWAMTWSLKIILYVFTSYMGITGAISGSADATALKATKLAISGAVPVVGSIMADASDTILISAGVMKNAVGAYGMIAVIAVLAGPFLRCGVYYLLLKFTAAVCGMVGTKKNCELINDTAGTMGLVLAITGTVGLLLFVSVVCFMKGIG